MMFGVEGVEGVPSMAMNNLSNNLYKLNWKNINWLHKYFKAKLGYNTSLGILASIIKESGGDPHRKQINNGPGRGLVQWEYGTDRYKAMKAYKMKGALEKGIDPELQRQAEYIYSTVYNPQKSGSGLWHDGGKGSGYKTAEDARSKFINAKSSASQKARAFSLGYVRPRDGVTEAKARMGYVASLDSVYNSKYRE